MTEPVARERVDTPACPSCDSPMRREFDGVRNPPLPGVFWFCTDLECDDGRRNKLYHGG